MRAEASVPIFFILERLMWLLYAFVYVCACLCVCWYACLYFSISGEDTQSEEGSNSSTVIIGAVVGSVVAVAVIVVIVIVVIRRRRAGKQNFSVTGTVSRTTSNVIDTDK